MTSLSSICRYVALTIDRDPHLSVQAATRPAGGVWTTPVDLSAPGENAQDPQVRFDGQGIAIAVWEQSSGANDIVQAATRPAGGVWTTPVDLSATGENADAPQLAVDGQGDATAVWDWSGGANDIVQAATRPAGGAWTTPVNLSAPGEGAGGYPHIAFDGQGNATAVWSRSNGANDIVQTATRPAGGVWTTPVNLSGPGEDADDGPQVAVDGQGDATAVWSGFDATNLIVQAAGYDAAGPHMNALAIPSTGATGQSLSFSVSPLDVWSPLGATTWNFGDGQSATGTTVTHVYTNPGSYTVTLTGADTLANTSSATQTIAITSPPEPAPAPPAPPGGPSITAPVLSHVSETHAVWRTGSGLASIAHAHATSRQPAAVGTTFAFTLNETAMLTLAFTKTGHVVHHHCVAHAKRNHPNHGACTHAAARATLTLTAHAGQNRIAFQGKVSQRRTLTPGHYRLAVTAIKATKHSARHILYFTITQ